MSVNIYDPSTGELTNITSPGYSLDIKDLMRLSNIQISPSDSNSIIISNDSLMRGRVVDLQLCLYQSVEIPANTSLSVAYIQTDTNARPLAVQTSVTFSETTGVPLQVIVENNGTIKIKTYSSKLPANERVRIHLCYIV